MIVIDAMLPRIDAVGYDARLLLELRARRLGELRAAKVRIRPEDEVPDVRTSAHILYGLDDPRVERLAALAGETPGAEPKLSPWSRS